MFGGLFGGNQQDEASGSGNPRGQPQRQGTEMSNHSGGGGGGGGGGWFGFGRKESAESQQQQQQQQQQPQGDGEARSARNWFPGLRQEEANTSSNLPTLGFGALGGLEPNSICPELTYKQRLYGFLACLCMGTLLSLTSWMRLLRIASGNADSVAVTFTLGNLIALAGTTFLVGPKTQCNRMFEESRMKWSVLFIGAMVLTIVVAYSDAFPFRNVIILGLIGAQYFALLWYTLSYIPYGHAMFKRLVQSCCSSGNGTSNS